MSEERLRNAKALERAMKYQDRDDGHWRIDIDYETFKFIREQAERVQKLEDELMAYKSIARNNKRLGENMLSDSIKECRRIKKEITFVNDRRLHHKEKAERYRKALEYIADNKIEHGWHLKAVNCVVRARRALEREKE